jgi:hypothetical protein
VGGFTHSNPLRTSAQQHTFQTPPSSFLRFSLRTLVERGQLNSRVPQQHLCACSVPSHLCPQLPHEGCEFHDCNPCGCIRRGGGGGAGARFEQASDAAFHARRGISTRPMGRSDPLLNSSAAAPSPLFHCILLSSSSLQPPHLSSATALFSLLHYPLLNISISPIPSITPPPSSLNFFNPQILIYLNSSILQC